MVLGQVGFGELQVSKLSSAVSCSRPRNQDLNTASKVTDVSEDKQSLLCKRHSIQEG